MGLIDFFKNLGKNADIGKTLMGQEFSQELSQAKSQDNQTKLYSSYTNSGVQFTEVPNKFVIKYDGLLAKSGAQQIYAAVGYGSNESWEGTEYYQMMKTGKNTYQADIPVKKSGNINIAFKDNADNWDNNSGINYTFTNPFKEGSS